jgi:Calcineurin-like phosphoesterase
MAVRSALLIGDTHADFEVPNTRFSVLGRYLFHKRPDYVIHIGDFADCPSLGLWDRGKRKGEGQTWAKDCAAAIDANERLWEETDKHNKNVIAAGRPDLIYNPKKILLAGNHDWARIERYTNDHAEMHGSISMADLRYEEFGWQVIPFLEPYVLEGTTFSHYFPSGLLARPISGDGAAKKLADLTGGSCVAGHSHTLGLHHTGKGGKRRWGIVCGSYLDEQYQINGSAMSYVPRTTRQEWWNGVMLLHSMENGDLSPVIVPSTYLMKHFS